MSIAPLAMLMAACRLTTPSVAATAWTPLAQSVQGRPIQHQTVGNGPHHIVWVGGIHGDEPEGATTTAALPDAIRSAGLSRQVTVHIIEDLNPDGRAAQTRGNANGVDLNRNFPAPSFEPAPQHGHAPLDQPEAEALATLIQHTAPVLVLVAHSWREAHFVNPDGPPEAHTLAQVFATHSGYPVVLSDGIHPTPGSLGGWVGTTLHTPILTIEYERGEDPDVCWIQTRQAILSVIQTAAE